MPLLKGKSQAVISKDELRPVGRAKDKWGRAQEQEYFKLRKELEAGGMTKLQAHEEAMKRMEAKDSLAPVGRDADDEITRGLRRLWEVRTSSSTSEFLNKAERYITGTFGISPQRAEKIAREFVNDIASAKDSVGKDSLAPVGKDASPWEENVEQLSQDIKRTVQAARRDGTVSMSKANLKQLVSTRVRFPNANAFERGFEEAMGKSGARSFVHDELRPVGSTK